MARIGLFLGLPSLLRRALNEVTEEPLDSCRKVQGLGRKALRAHHEHKPSPHKKAGYKPLTHAQGGKLASIRHSFCFRTYLVFSL